MGLDNSHVRLSWALGFKKQAIKSWFELQKMQIGSICHVLFTWPLGAKNILGETRLQTVFRMLWEWV